MKKNYFLSLQLKYTFILIFLLFTNSPPITLANESGQTVLFAGMVAEQGITYANGIGSLKKAFGSCEEGWRPNPNPWIEGLKCFFVHKSIMATLWLIFIWGILCSSSKKTWIQGMGFGIFISILATILPYNSMRFLINLPTLVFNQLFFRSFILSSPLLFLISNIPFYGILFGFFSKKITKDSISEKIWRTTTKILLIIYALLLALMAFVLIISAYGSYG